MTHRGSGRSSRILTQLAVIVLASAGVAVEAHAQLRAMAGVGAGMAGSTDQSLSNGSGGTTLKGQATWGVLPLVHIGVDGTQWHRGGSSLTTGVAILQVHLPILPFYGQIGGGFGSGNPDNAGTVHGTAGQIGLGYDLGVPIIPIALTVYGDATLIHGSSRSLQLVEAGVALTWK